MKKRILNMKDTVYHYRFLFIVSILAMIIVFSYALIQRKTVDIVIDGKTQTVVTYKKTVGSLLKSESIDVDFKDKMDRGFEDRISRHDIVNIKRAADVNVSVDGRELKIKTAENKVESMLKTEGITLGKEDKVFPALNENISKGMSVNIVRVETKTVTENTAVDFPKTVKLDPNLLETQTKVQQSGVNGEKQVTYKVVLENGKEVVKDLIKEVVTKQPVAEILIKGSLPVFNVSRGDSGISYTKEFVCKSTAYYAINGVGKTYTASGRKAVRDPYGYSTIAVDPTIIPLGTRMYVEGYGYAVAADTGTDIKGNFIDVYFDTYKEAVTWAVKYVKVYILK